MAQPKSKQELTRLAWLTELRRQGYRQCHGINTGGSSRVCAMQLLAEIVSGSRRDDYTIAAKAAGLSCGQINEITARNDGGFYGSATHHRMHTFSEIADVVEGWFRTEPKL